MPSRRAVLAALGATGLVGLAGCAERTEPPLEVTNIDIRQSFEWRKAGTHVQGVTLTDQQLVLVDIPESAGVPSQADVTLVVGEESVDPASAVAGVDRHKLSWVRDRTGL